MADEENPFGGGPFGVGPFGPLVATAAAVATAMIGASVTTSVPRTKTLFYQANVFVAVPDEVLNPPPPATAESFSITTGQVSRKTLFYQANIAPPAYIPPAEVVAVNIGWHAPFSAPPPRQLVLQRQLNQQFVPPVAPQVTTAGWLQPFQRQVVGPFPVHTQPVLAYTAAPQPTPDEWLQPFQRAVPVPAVHHTQPISGYQPEAVVSNLTTTLEWLQPFQKAVPPPHPALSQPVFGYQPEAAVVSNLTTSLEWMVAWQSAKPTRPVHTQPVHAQPTPNLTATLEWQVAWQKAVPAPPVRHTQPVFGYPYPTVENTIAGLGWVYRFERAVPAQPVHHTQPVHAQPTPNLTATLEWLQPWQGPPRTLQRLAAGPGFFLPPSNYRNEWDWPLAWNLAAKATKPVHTQPVFGYQPEAGVVSNLTTSIEWQQNWQGPPRGLQRLAAGPVLPPAATPTVANTITGIAWLQGWNAPPRYWPIKVQQTPFIPKEFVQDQITPDKWLLAFQKAVPRQPVRYTQPVLGRSDAARLDVAWLQAWPRAVAARPVSPTQPPFVYSPPPAPVTLTTTLEWQQPLSVAVRTPPVRPTQPSLYLPEVVVVAEAATAKSFSFTSAYPLRKTLFYQAHVWSYAPPAALPPNTVFIDKWQQPLSKVLYRQVPRPTQPFYGYPYVQVEVPPIEPVPPEIIQPKHSHGQITSVTARTTIDSSADVCVPAFQQDAFQFNAFQTCIGPSTTAVTSRGGVRVAGRIHTSSRWRRSRTTIRTSGKGRTRPKDDP